MADAMKQNSWKLEFTFLVLEFLDFGQRIFAACSFDFLLSPCDTEDFPNSLDVIIGSNRFLLFDGVGCVLEVDRRLIESSCALNLERSER